MNVVAFFIILQMGIMVSLDVLVPRFPALGMVGMAYWGLMWFTLLIYALSCLVRAARIIKRHAMWMSACISLTFIALFVLWAYDPRFLSGESTREIGCALAHLRSTKDLGFAQTCHLGYPARQFFVPAIPTILWGETLPALQIGNILYFCMGYVVFVHGLLLMTQKKLWADLKTGLILSSLAHFPLAHAIILTYEQASYPIGFALFVAGLWLEWIYDKSVLILLLIGLMQFVLITSYTPSLSLVFLNVAMFVYSAYRLRKQKIYVWITPVLLVVISFISLWVSFQTRSDIRIFAPKESGPLYTHILDAVRDVWNTILFARGAVPWVSPLLTLPFILLILISMFGIFGASYSVISFWIVLVMFIAVFSHGYASGSIDYRLQRATIAIPFFLLLISKTLERVHIPRNILIAGLLLVSLTGYTTLSQAKARKADTHQAAIASLLQPILKTTSPEHTQKWIYFTPEIESVAKVDNFTDIAMYFLPGWKSEVVRNGQPCSFAGTWITLAAQSCLAKSQQLPSVRLKSEEIYVLTSLKEDLATEIEIVTSY